jgi:diguanylate cyclase (GGDEF)-like protein
VVRHEVVGHEVVRNEVVGGGVDRRRDGLRRAALAGLAGAIAAAAIALFAFVVRDLPAYETGPHLPWWALAAAFAATELFVVHAHVRGSAHSLSLSELPLILGLLLATPQDLVIAQVLGPAVVLCLTRGHSPIKLVFNLAQFGLTAALAVITLHLIVAPGAEFGPALWGATFAAVAVGAVTGATLVFSAIALAEGVIPSRRLALMMGADLLVAMTNTSVGLAAAIVLARDPRAGWLLIAPACILLLAYRAYLSERTKHESLEFLYGVARSLSRAHDIETALADLLRRTRDSFRVQTAEIVLFSGEDTPLRTALTAAGVEERMEPIEPALASALRDCVGREHAILLDRGEVRGQLRRYLELRGIEQALVAPVPGETRLTGVMLLGDRLGAAATFTAEDLRLFETLANHAGISLEYDRLEQAVTRMRELQQRLERQAFRDSLTGLANRARFLRRLEESLARDEGTTTVLFLDLDDFKRINDDSGHAAGDAVLVETAVRLRTCVRPDDLAARLGGDEFAVLLEDVDDHHAERVADRMLELLGTPVRLPDSQDAAWVHGSVGIASAKAGSLGADELIRQADVAMYRSKQAGKGQVRVFCPEMHPGALARPPRRDEIDEALAAGELLAHFQPIVSLATGEVIAAEALARWQHPRHGLLAPANFVPAAEATGQVVAIDRVVLEHACRAAVGWDGTDGRPPAGAAVHANLSGEALRTFEVVAAVEDVLVRTGLAPCRLVLELTESVLVADTPIARQTLCALRDLGVRIALDDFGTGYSSLSSLRTLPIDLLKVAKPFVDGAARTPHDRALMRMIVDLGGLFDIRVVAEGIEREEQLGALRELGCELGQGYLLGRPMELRPSLPAGAPRAAAPAAVA